MFIIGRVDKWKKFFDEGVNEGRSIFILVLVSFLCDTRCSIVSSKCETSSSYMNATLSDSLT